MKSTLTFTSHLGLQHIQKQKNSKRVGYKISKFCRYYNMRCVLKSNGTVHWGYDFFVYNCLMLEVMNFCMLMTKITFFLVNSTKTSRNYAPKKSNDSLKNCI